MVAFVPSFLATFRNGFVPRETKCAVLKRGRNHVWRSNLDGTSGNGANFPSETSLQNAESSARTTSENVELGSEFNEELPDPYEIVRDARTISVKLPLDAYLEETASGQVFVDELVPGGNAEKSGLILEGDIIVAVSLPFGDAMFPVPDFDAITMVQDHVRTRDESEEFFNMAVVSSAGVEVLRQELADKAQREVDNLKKMEENIEKINIDEYPTVKKESTDGEVVEFDAEFLRTQGFNV